MQPSYEKSFTLLHASNIAIDTNDDNDPKEKKTNPLKAFGSLLLGVVTVTSYPLVPRKEGRRAYWWQSLIWLVIALVIPLVVGENRLTSQAIRLHEQLMIKGVETLWGHSSSNLLNRKTSKTEMSDRSQIPITTGLSSWSLSSTTVKIHSKAIVLCQQGAKQE